MESTLNQSDSEVWNHIAPLLDDALGRLGEKEHDAVVLRFLDGKELKQVGAAMGISEDAARMRVNRGLENLRAFFNKKSVTLSATGIAGTIAANSIQAAPVGLAATITAAALSGTTITTAAVIAATKTITMTIMKTIVLALALAGGIAVLGYHQLNTQRQLRVARASVGQQAEEIQALRTVNEQLVGQTNELKRLREEAKDVLRLRAEVARLRQEQAVLKKSAAQIAQAKTNNIAKPGEPSILITAKFISIPTDNLNESGW